ncbi:hypothetical protein ONS95_009080 [Cadophora gregata]|uniref:uncharacterized protein n=1 Tax=Cadophora gregata TaxID=51156 RepID=UPI0026DA87E7|nr:uncharacterized protein ONS95_009080 [Cadophora gregata]KAK0124096.1 hypothetical protein ONS95_009080 [Cadophora gregata]KAK0130429.1 hypothetical protein ONS96_000949 [Cadophora gregata f. sp. sojae]
MIPAWIRSSSESRASQEEKDSGSVENLLPSSLDDYQQAQYKGRRQQRADRRYWILTLLNIILFIVSLVVLAREVNDDKIYSRDRRWLLKQTSYFSPVLEKLDIKTSVKQTDGSLFESPNPSPYRNARRPDPAVDAAWEAIDNIRTFPITAEEVRKLGKDPELVAKFPEEYGLGPDAYVAELDIFHQIHCLNLLRNIAWVEYGRSEDHGKKPYSELHWVHVSHCTDMLMQTLMCQGSLDVLTFNWMETQEWPYPDFFVNRQCRDFDAIVKWQDEHSLPLMMGRNLTRPEGAKEIPAPAAFYEMFGKESNVSIHDKL